jgi:hypothetical protein
MEREELLKKTAYLTDNINKKVRSFKKENYGGYYDYMLNNTTAEYDTKINLKMKSGYLTKSKKELNKLSDLDLQNLYDDLQKLQTNEKHGTTKRFNQIEKPNLEKSLSTIKNTIGVERFNKIKGDKSEVDTMIEFIKRKDELNNKKGATYSSIQILVQMSIENPTSEEDKKIMLRTADRMEQARELMQRNTVVMEGRRKSGNRN